MCAAEASTGRRILKGKPFVNEFTVNMKTAQHIQLEKKKSLRGRRQRWKTESKGKNMKNRIQGVSYVGEKGSLRTEGDRSGQG